MKRTDLLEALKNVLPGIDESELVEQTSNVVFDGNIIYTYNDEISVTYPLESGVTCAVRAGELSKIIQRMEDEDIKIEVTKKEMIIKGKQFKAGLPVSSEIVLPNPAKEDLPKWSKLPEGFVVGMQFCIFSASTDISQGVLTCLRIEGDGIVSGDNLRFTKYKMNDELKGDAVLIPVTAAKQLVKHDLRKMSRGKAWLHFQSPTKVIFSCRTMNDDYPNIEDLLKVKGSAVILPTELPQVLDRVAVPIQSEREGCVTIIIDKKKLTCKSQGGAGWAEETAKVKYDGPKIAFYANPSILTQILKLTQRSIVGENRILFRGVKFQHVMALMVS